MRCFSRSTRSFAELALVGALAASAGWPARAHADVPEESVSARVGAAVVSAVEARLGRGLRVDLEDLTCALAVDPPGALTATPDPAGRLGRSIRFAIATSPVGPRGSAVRVGEATAIVRVSGEHVRARRMVTAGHTLEADDLELSEGPIDGVPLRRLPSMREAVGTRATRALEPGQPIAADAVAARPVVRAGDRVRVIARSLGVEATVVGIAEQSGMLDQVIRVVNPESRRAVRARVVAAGEVEVVNGR